jgi:exosortase A-associated hydrolase 2
MASNETPLFFSTATSRLFGVFHGTSESRKLPLLFCHPFGEEKLWTHRVFVTFARELERRGHPVLRFDYMGNGDSSGDFAASSVATVLADVNGAGEWLKERTGQSQIGLLGLRFGASVAATVAESRDDVACLIQWAPIVDGSRYLQELLRINLSTQLAVYREVRVDREAMAAVLASGATVNVDGYEISPAMAEQLQSLRLDQPKRFKGRCLITQLDRSPEAKPQPELAGLASTYPEAAMQVLREEPFWKEIPRLYETAPNLFDTTLRWLGH